MARLYGEALAKGKGEWYRMSNDKKDGGVEDGRYSLMVANQGDKGRLSEREKKTWISAHGDPNTK